jgi:RNA polymerase sigma factor (sigma-70 family)
MSTDDEETAADVERREKEERDKKLWLRAVEKKIVPTRARVHEKDYRGLVTEDDLVSAGDAALPDIVARYDETRSGFESFLRHRVDWAMLGAIRVEARERRLHRAAQRANAELLALYRTDPSLDPLGRVDRIATDVAAATFAALCEEVLRGGEDDLAARQEYGIALEVIAAVLAALPAPQRKLMLLRYREDWTLREIEGALGVHYNTVERWHDKVLAALHKELDKRGIKTAPSRGSAPPAAVLVPLRGDDVDGDDDGGDDAG